MKIALAGQKRSGKTTVARRLVEEHGFIHMDFADPVRAAAMSFFGMTPEELERDKEKDIFFGSFVISPREFMQKMGTEWGRQTIDDSMWVEGLLARAATYHQLGKSIVVADARFQNETDTLRSQGYQIVHVSRPGYMNKADQHASEAGVKPHHEDLFLRNVGDIDYLEGCVDDMVDHIAMINKQSGICA